MSSLNDLFRVCGFAALVSSFLFIGVECQAVLVAHYEFDNPADVGAATVGDGLTASGDAAYSAVGVFDGALSLSGAGELATGTFPASLPTVDSSYTIAAFIQTTNEARNTIVSWGNQSTRQRNAFRTTTVGEGGVGDNGTPGILNYNWGGGANGDFGVGSGQDLYDGAWYHAAVTYDATTSTKRLYVDGLQIGGDFNVANDLNVVATDFAIGTGFGGFGEAFIGLLDDVRIYSSPLSQSEIAALLPAPALLDLQVNTTSGVVTLSNPSASPIEINYYRIRSVDGLDVGVDLANWNSLEDQGIDAGTASDGDFNGDGTVDAGDYTVWRDNVGSNTPLPNDDGLGTPIGQAHFDLWRSNFGATGGGAGNGWVEADEADENELAELFLSGSSVIDPLSSETINLGAIFDTALDPLQDLVFEYGVVGSNNLTQGTITPAAPGALTGAPIPEPRSLIVVLIGFPALLLLSRRRTVVLAIPVALVALSNDLSAATTDRLYQFGDPGSADATLTFPDVDVAANVSEGAGMGFILNGVTSTGDDTGPSGGGFVDLDVFGPTYTTAASRPGADLGDFAASFDGFDDYLSAPRLGLPATSFSSLGYIDPVTLLPSPGPLNYNGIANRGIQLWARPSSAGNGTAQSLVADTLQHGVRISSAGTWVLQYAGSEVDSGDAVAFDDWSHVMVVRPFGPSGGSQLYVDGVIVAAAAGGYTGADNTPLVVGANTDEISPGTTDFYNGAIDDLELFILGDNSSDAGPPQGQDYGTFNPTDNDFIADALAGKPQGDITLDGVVNGADEAAFITNWLSKNEVNGLLVGGDLNSYQRGDLDLDGDVDIQDAFLLHEGIQLAGGAGLDFGRLGASVPEPSTLLLLGVVATTLVGSRFANRSKQS